MQINVLEYLDSTVKLFPDKIAFADENEKITFAELYNFSNSIATNIIKRGKGKFFKVPVAVFIEKSVKAVASFLGVVRAGCFYTPIDVDTPLPRLKKIFETLKPSVIITDKKLTSDLQSIINEDVEVLFYEDLIKTQPDNLLIQNISEKAINTDVLYVLFTSGSTGVPKGVVVGHRSVIDYVDWLEDTFKFTNENILGNQAPFYFDNSVLDIYVTLKTGATTYLIPKKKFAFPLRVLEFIRDKKIDTIFWVPSLLTQIANFDLLDECEIDCLHNIIFAGEVMPTKQLNMWIRRLPNAIFANLYGPTEITVDCTYYIVNRDFKDTEPLPIGKPCRNTDILVLNEKNLPVQGQEQGELCVRGTSLAYGYYNDFEKTSKVFVQNPLNIQYPEKIYRTGDLVHYNVEGELIFDGRKDFQIKHMGNRIELGEIELAVASIQEIKMNCCIFNADEDKIVLFYVGEISAEELRRRLPKLLPNYMIPNQYFNLPEMPFNMNGKIDRTKLKEMFVKE